MKKENITQAKLPLDSEPATPLMKKVAERTADFARMRKDFSPAEIEEILAKRMDGEALSTVEVRALRDKYRKMKRWVLEKEKTNRDQIMNCSPSML